MEIKVNDKVIEYYKFGSGSKTMVIIPGVGVKSCIPLGYQLEQAYNIFKKDYTVYLIERADKLNDEDNVFSIAEDYINVFEKLNLKDIYLFGASLGGMISQIISSLRPELIKKLVLVSTISGTVDSKDKIKNWYDLASSKQLKLLALTMLNDIYSPSTAEIIKDATVSQCLNLTEADIKRFLIQLKVILSFNSASYLAKINCPSLVISAKGDKVFTYHEGEYLRNHIKNSKFVLYDENNYHALYDENITVKNDIYDFFN